MPFYSKKSKEAYIMVNFKRTSRVALTMLLVVIIGSLIGLLLPFIFTKLKLDPATASATLITFIADILGIVIYFSLASHFLGF